jgi:16S rRNA (uracil1498-N3)-methyltransferase
VPLHRFYLNPEHCHDTTLVLTGREAHHGLNVLRLRAGERVTVLDGVGHEYLCEVQELNRDSVRLAVRQKNSISALPFQVTLLQAIPKGKLFEAIVQKATELGVSRIVPLLSERVVTHLDDERAEHKVDKWRAVAIEAIKQCGSAWLPQMDPPASPQAFLSQNDKFDLMLVASLQDDRRHPREWFRKFEADMGRLPGSVGVWVGPEGDFTPAELNAIKAGGAWPISLGRLVLRSETAAVYCLSILNYELQANAG